MHIHGGRLYGIKITGHMLYELLIEPKGLKPSKASPSLMLQGSEAKFGYFSSKLFHVNESAGCRNTPSSTHSSLCHLISFAVPLVINNRCNLGIIGKYLRII